ncbi:TPA: host specificity protein J, partial [Escherichia coli]
NPAWCLWDMLTHPRYGMGKRVGAADVDKWALYVIGQYCDQSVPDGFGGTEPRITCNAWLTTQRKAWDVLSDFCSAMRCMPVWNGQTLTFVQDRPSDKVWTYNRSNVVMPDDGAPFRYSFSALKDRHNAVEVNWSDPDNGQETATELVEDTQAIARYGRNVTKMDAFGCTSRGQAHRAGLWLIKTELLETQTVDFSVGAEGLRHVPGDVIEICDDDYAGISTGGRVLTVNSQTRTLTLDREITLPSSGTTLISLVDGSGNPVSVEVQSVTDGVKVKVSRVPDGVAEYSVWGLKLPTLRQRLFRCVSIRENDDGTYAITAVQHVPEKEAIVDNGAHFDGDQSGTVNGVTPPAVQHLTAEVTADSGEYQVLARWDTPKVVKGVSFLLRLTVAADDGSERLVSTARTTETTYRFRQLAPGNYRLTVRAVNARGQQGDPASVSFRIAAPAAPSRIELTPGYFQITATPHLAVYDPTVQFEFWFSETRITDIRQVETTARYLGTGSQWLVSGQNIKPGHDYYFYIRSVNTVGKSAFVEAVGRASNDPAGYLNFFRGAINKTHLGREINERIDASARRTEVEQLENAINREMTQLEKDVRQRAERDIAEVTKKITASENSITELVAKKSGEQSLAIAKVDRKVDSVSSEIRQTVSRSTEENSRQIAQVRQYVDDKSAQISTVVAKKSGEQSMAIAEVDRKVDRMGSEIRQTVSRSTEENSRQIAQIRQYVDDKGSQITQSTDKKLGSWNASIEQIQKVQEDTRRNLNSMWAVKLQQTRDGRLYIAGIGAGIENTSDGIQSQILMQADRIAMINPENGNTTPLFVAQGDQLFMNDVFMKKLTVDFARVTGDIRSDNFHSGSPGWRLSRNGSLEINSGRPGAGRLFFNGERIDVYDDNNVLRVRLGRL